MTRFSENDAAAARARDAAQEEAACDLSESGRARPTAAVELSKFRRRTFATLSGADNIFEITSARYGPTGASTPLIIRVSTSHMARCLSDVIRQVDALMRERFA